HRSRSRLARGRGRPGGPARRTHRNRIDARGRLEPLGSVGVDHLGELGMARRRNRNLNLDALCLRHPDQPCESHDDGQLPRNLHLDRTRPKAAKFGLTLPMVWSAGTVWVARTEDLAARTRRLPSRIQAANEWQCSAETCHLGAWREHDGPFETLA